MDELIKKYLDAETSLNEETILRNYFMGDVEEHHNIYKPLFTYFELASKETYKENVVKNNNWSWMRIAASIVLVIGLYFGYQGQQQAELNQAIVQTESALNLLGKNLNKGTTSFAYLGEFDKATSKIFKR
jgi:hypothetical protein